MSRLPSLANSTLSALPKSYEKTIKEWLNNNCPSIKRVSKGHITLTYSWFVKWWYAPGSIDRDKEIFIPSKDQQSLTRDYQLIFDIVVEEHLDHSHQSKICRKVIRWNPVFEQLCWDLMHQLIKDLTSNPSILSYPIHNVVIKAETLFAMAQLMPGFDEKNYKAVPGDSRLYHPAQTLSKPIKQKVYAGLCDFDIVSCFPMIFYKHFVDGKEKINEDAILMGTNPEAFLQKIIDTGAFDSLTSKDRTGAKIMRSKLFARKNGKRCAKRIGVKWYDELLIFIQGTLEKEGIESSHTFFTEIERSLIEIAGSIIGKENVYVRMHDGIIALVSDPQNRVQLLKDITGFEWKVRILGED